MKNLTIIMLLLAVMSGCSQAKRCQRHYRLSEPCRTSNVITIEKLRDTGKTIVFKDSAELERVADSLTEMYSRIIDSCRNKGVIIPKESEPKRFKEKTKQLINQIPCKIKPISVDSARFSLKIWVEGDSLRYDFEIKELEVESDCPDCPEPAKWYEKMWLLWIIVAAVFVNRINHK